MDKEIQTLTLTREEWKEKAKLLMVVADALDGMMSEIDDSSDRENAAQFRADLFCAVTAMNYVAEFAADKCVFVGVTDDDF